MILSLLWNGIHFQLCRLCVCICYKSNEWIAACHPFHFVGFIFLYSHWSLIISYIDKWQEYSESDKWFWLHTHTHTPYYCSSSLASFGWHNIVHFRLCSNDFFSISVPHSITRYKINDFNFFFLLDLIMNQTNMWLCVCVCVCGVQYIVVEFVQNIRLSNSQISIHLYIVENSQFNPYLSQISKWLSCLSIISSIFQINRLIWTCTRTHTTKFNKELIKLSQKKILPKTN